MYHGNGMPGPGTREGSICCQFEPRHVLRIEREGLAVRKLAVAVRTPDEKKPPIVRTGDAYLVSAGRHEQAMCLDTLNYLGGGGGG